MLIKKNTWQKLAIMKKEKSFSVTNVACKFEPVPCSLVEFLTIWQPCHVKHDPNPIKKFAAG
jgi:hypothetical protein